MGGVQDVCEDVSSACSRLATSPDRVTNERTATSPELLLTSGGQVAVDKAEGRAVEHEGHAHRPLVSYKTNVEAMNLGLTFTV